jgi:hypothetical protein
MHVIGLFSPFMREAKEMTYEWEVPFVIDDARFRKTFGYTDRRGRCDDGRLGALTLWRPDLAFDRDLVQPRHASDELPDVDHRLGALGLFTLTVFG